MRSPSHPSRAQWLRRLAQRKRDRIAFVLSGGGPLGALQVGALRALLEKDIRPELATGTSVGALNATFVAFDPTIDGIRRLESTWRRMTDDDLFPTRRVNVPWARMVRKGSSVFPNSGIRRLVETQLPGARFEDTVVPLAIVATDIETGFEKVFTSGEVLKPLLASAAMPGVFPPIEIDGRLYVDGGVANNVPIGPAVSMGAKTLYVMNATAHSLQRRPLVRPLDYLLHAFSLARSQRLFFDQPFYAERVRIVMLPSVPLDFYVPFASMRHTARLLDMAYEETSRFLDGRADAVVQRVGEAEVEAIFPAK